ncbi:MAG: NAD(P)H-hydrate dehydratase [Treponema sp.]|nr:NAD(P)H-hydrate dehydratase [Treponema sp.]
MEKIFLDTRELDEEVRERFALTEDLMMENAAAALEEKTEQILKNHKGENFISRPSVLVLTGSGNNGADGFALSRRLYCHDYSVTVCQVFEPKSEMCILQKKRAKQLGVNFINIYDLDDFIAEKSFDLKVAVDCIFGSGFHGELPYEAKAVLESVNQIDGCTKIACDIPSGLYFKADFTVTMGALKTQLFTDKSKDVCGKISVANLGVQRSNFENSLKVQPKAFLLEEKDLTLPLRNTQNVNKGTFGHAVIVSGNKIGAGVIAATAALKFGAGLVSLKGKNLEQKNIPFEIMTDENFPTNTSAVAAGMGLGNSGEEILEYLLQTKLPAVLDADIFTCEEKENQKITLKEFLSERSKLKCETVLTPHPKEFISLLRKCALGNFSVHEILENKIELAEKFCNAFPHTALVLKGSVTVIGHKNSTENKVQLYVNRFGSNAMAKGGSGDVLSGLTVSLLAQGKNALESAVTSVLAHSLAGEKFKNSFSLTPFELIEKISEQKNQQHKFYFKR